MTTQQFKVGVAHRKITPTPEMGPVYRAGYKMGEAERLAGTVDDIFLRCLSIENEGSRIIFLSLDLIGLFRDFTSELASKLAPLDIATENLIVATTHMHSGPDTMGLWGPSFGESGYNENYGEFLLNASADAINEALSSSRPARALISFAEKNLGIANYREPDELNLDLWCILFKHDDEPIGSLFSYSAQPELAPRDDDRISGDYPGEACRLLEKELGGTALFLLGACGGMEPEGCEKGYEAAHEYGRNLANELLRMSKDASPLSETTLAVTTAEVELPVENPGFQMMMESGAIKTSQKPPNAISTISKVQLGEITIFTIPGESFPGITAGIGEKGNTLFINQANDSLGYFIPAEQFRAEPHEWAEGHHFTGHEMESLGRSAGEAIRQTLLKISSE